jgi:nucleoside-diphosphate kinase
VLGTIIAAFEEHGLRLTAADIRTLSAHEARELYGQHEQSFFFPRLIEYMCSGPVFVCVLEGEGAIAALRSLIGPTDPAQASPNTLRGQFGDDILHNGLHGSLSEERANFQTKLLFPELT